MFWSKNKNKDKRGSAEQKSAKSGVRVPKGQNNSSKSQRLREEALANARKARAEIGEETLDKIAALMTKKQQSVMEQAKRDIAEQDAHRVAEEILLILDEK